MSNIAITELESESTQLKDNDYILVSNDNGNGSYTSMKMKGSVVKAGSTGTCLFTEDKVKNAVTSYGAAKSSDITSAKDDIVTNIQNLNNLSKEQVAEAIDSHNISSDVQKLVDRMTVEKSKESASFVMCGTESKYYACNASATSSAEMTILKDSRLIARNLSSTENAILSVYNKLTGSWISISQIYPNEFREYSFKANQKIKFNGSVKYDLIPYWYATDLKYLSDSVITLNPTSYTYDNYDSDLTPGTTVTPEVTCVYDGTTLVKDSDYTVTYSQNILKQPNVSFDPLSSMGGYGKIIKNGTMKGNVLLSSVDNSEYSGKVSTTFDKKWSWIGAAIAVQTRHQTSSTTYVGGSILWSKTKKQSESSNIQYPLTCVATGGYNFTLETSTSERIISYSTFGTKHLKITAANGVVLYDQDFTIYDPKL